MMKLRRLIASMLALLLMVSLLPMAAMADDLPNNTDSQVLINQPIGTNSGSGVGIAENGSVQTNTGSIAENEGTVSTNNGKIVENKQTVENNVAVENTPTENEFDPPYKEGTGHIENNNAGATVVNNQAGSTVEKNNAGGIIEKNSGYVGDWRYGVEHFQTNSGNKGTVQDNLANGKVNNLKGGTVTNNGGTVYNDGGGTVVDNNAGGTVYNNGGTVVDNNAGGKVDNNEGGEVGTNNAGGTVTNKGGTVGINNGMVYNNTSDSVVKVNEVSGRVANFSLGPDDDGPKVETNFGTVDYEVPGNDEYKTYYGVHYEVDGKKVYIDQFEESKPVTISELVIPRSGYKLVKCEKVEAYKTLVEMTDEPADPFVDVTDNEDITTKNDDGSVSGFTILAPTRLTLLWEKIASVFKPAPSNEPEAKPVKTTPVHTSLSADQVKVGAFVRRGNMTFKIIEVTDNDIRVATVGKLSEQDLADMLGCLKKHLSDAQIEKLIGEPELLEQELVTKFFGGSSEHIAFRAAKDLFA